MAAKKKNSQGIEFRFREGSVDPLQGKPLLYAFPENSSQALQLTMDQGEVKLVGDLQIFQGNFYTALAPVWIDLDQACKTCIRKEGEVTLALYVPSEKYRQPETTIQIIEPTQNPTQFAEQYGALVAVLKFRRAN